MCSAERMSRTDTTSLAKVGDASARPLRAALLTPPAPAALATVRIEGPAAISTLRGIFRPVAPELHADRPAYGSLHDDDDLIDHAIVTIDPDGNGCEIHTHAGPRIIQRLLELLRRSGVDVVPWDRLRPADSLAREVEMTLPRALTRIAALSIAAQHPGGLTQLCDEAIRELAGCTADVAGTRDRLAAVAATYTLGERLLVPPVVALAGPVNVGKSTLANALTGRVQSLAADLPGTTHDWTEALADFHGLPVRLLDTPGQRQTHDPIEREALALASERLAEADLVVLVVEPGDDLAQRIETQRQGLPTTAQLLVAVNKIDLCPNIAIPADAVAISALGELNLDALRTAVAERFGLVEGYDPTTPLIFTPRQHELIARAVMALDAGDTSTAKKTLEELIGS